MKITRAEAIWQIQKTVEDFSSFVCSNINTDYYNHLTPEAIIIFSRANDFSKSFEIVKREGVLYVLNNDGLQELYCMLQELDSYFSDYCPFQNLYKTPIQIIDNDDKCIHKDSAINIANYIVNEIQINLKSKIAESISYALDYEGRLEEWNKLDTLQKVIVPVPQPMVGEAIILWYNQVAPNQPWDHKPLIREKFSSYGVERPLSSGTPSKSYYHKYKNHDYYYDVWSNIHYGYVGMCCGFTSDQLLDGAGLAQLISDGTNYLLRKVKDKPTPTESSKGLRKFDALADRISVKLGISLYNRFGNNTGALSGLLLLEELEKLPSIDESRLIHICYDFSDHKRTKD